LDLQWNVVLETIRSNRRSGLRTSHRRPSSISMRTFGFVRSPATAGYCGINRRYPALISMIVRCSTAGLLATIVAHDPELRPIIDARVSLRSRGPKVEPLRGAADAEGVARLRAPEPGEYTFKVEVPGYLPARIERLVLGRKAPRVTVVLTPRPLDYPARPAELLPEERAVPPEGFPGSSENAAPAAGIALPAPPGTASTNPVPPRP